MIALDSTVAVSFRIIFESLNTKIHNTLLETGGQ